MLKCTGGTTSILKVKSQDVFLQVTYNHTVGHNIILTAKGQNVLLR